MPGGCHELRCVKTTACFREMRKRPDRAAILDEWIVQTVEDPMAEERQPDGRIRRWRRIPEMDNRALRDILPEVGETVHNAFFDRGFTDDEGQVLPGHRHPLP